jgi:hypothetical protein
MCYVEAKSSTSDPDSNTIDGSNSKVAIIKSKTIWLASEYIYTNAKICNPRQPEMQVTLNENDYRHNLHC